MADRRLENYAVLGGNYGDLPFANTRSTVVEVTLAEIPFSKSADQSLWFDGQLTFTLTINNTGDSAITNAVITDTLDVTKFAYVPNSVVVRIDGVESTAFTATYTAPLLTVNLTEAIAVGQIVMISFRGEKVPE